MDNLSTLQEGSTTGDAELIGIRTGYDGTNYNSAGEAVREQIQKIMTINDYIINTIWKNGYSLNQSEEVPQQNRCISDYIKINGKTITIYALKNDIKFDILYYDKDYNYIGNSGYNNTFKNTVAHTNYIYCRLRIGKNDDTTPSDYSYLTGNIIIKQSDDDNMIYRGNIIQLGYSSCYECTKNGYYSFTNLDIQNISDFPNMDNPSGGILNVYNNAATNVRFQTIITTYHYIYFRYGNNTFTKIMPVDANSLTNNFTYRGCVSDYNITKFSQLTEDGYYTVKASDKSMINDYPSDMDLGGYLIVYKNTATNQISQELNSIRGQRYFRYGDSEFSNIIPSISNCMQYNGNIQTLGYSTIKSCNKIGYYNCPTAYIENLTDKPSSLYSGFIVEVYPYAAGGATYQIITDNNGDQWFRYNDKPFMKRNSNGYEKPVWYALGDSITQGFYSYYDENNEPKIATTPNCWAKVVSDLNGYTLYNYAVGGSGYVHNATIQDGLNARNHILSEDIDIDFSNCNLVTLAYGINDWKGNDNFGSFDDNIETGGTVYSNMRYIIEKILTDNPNCKIFIITPINASRYGNYNGNWSLSHNNTYNKTLEDMYLLQKTVADYYGIEIIDMTHNSVFNRVNIQSLMVDGVHPTLTAHMLMGRELSKKIHF